MAWARIWVTLLWLGQAAGWAGEPDLAARLSPSPEGGIIRGPATARNLALVFTGHEYGEGGPRFLDELSMHRARASFFLTGDFLSGSNHTQLVRRIVKEGHYLGPHSDKHLLYCPWEGPQTTLIGHEQFVRDLRANLGKIESYGLSRTNVRYFLPPFEHYNRQVVQWSRELELTLINY